MKKLALYVFAFSLVITNTGMVIAQKTGNDQIREMIEKYKKDPRGPYKAIRWFCPDGSTVPPDQRCPQPGGVQHAQYKDEVVKLGKTNHIFLGQILTTTKFEDVWDSSNFNSRLKQYMMEKYLKLNDNGWIQIKSQYYRGAVQLEDEEEWGSGFFDRLLKNDEIIEKKFYLLREAFRDLPRKGKNNVTQRIRATSKSIGDSLSSFMDIRIKLHGNPEYEDLNKVKNFYSKNSGRLKISTKAEFEKLISDLEEYYAPTDWNAIITSVKVLNDKRQIKHDILKMTEFCSSGSTPVASRLTSIGEMLLKIRKSLFDEKSKKAREILLGISLSLEEIFLREASTWEPLNIKESLQKLIGEGNAMTGTGLLEFKEWERLKPILETGASEEISLGRLADIISYSSRMLEWGTSMVSSVFKDVVTLYSGFEPLSNGFIDDKLRSSVLLQAGLDQELLSSFYYSKIKLPNYIMGLNVSGKIRGLNPGYSSGKLEVVEDDELLENPDPEKIYVFYRPPSDLKPVAGIINVTEGNALSHVQLLARNLGIPNAVCTKDIFQQIKTFSGRKVFYAVSEMGTVILKADENLSEEERSLVEKKKVLDERVSVPVDKLNLKNKSIVNLRSVRSGDSGKLCGPKAANLGQLKFLFPDNVIEGFVIPFGIFKDHMDQKISGEKTTYWQFLENIFSSSAGIADKKEKEKFILEKLSALRNHISKMPLKESFLKELENSFNTILGNPVGKVCVFLRSDTNMEDLKDFTGAGLNLTLFNVLGKEAVLQGIRDVWASPYTERSYQWRQKVLNNPEDVYPSILVIPSVDVEKSGVVITKALYGSRESGITMAFSRGAGGAVEGQSAETYVVSDKGRIRMISPAREFMKRTLPETGGTGVVETSLNIPILSDKEIKDVQSYSGSIENKLINEVRAYDNGPFDIELGIMDGKIWLFQVRPFVENKRFAKLKYLQSLDPEIDYNKKISLKEEL